MLNKLAQREVRMMLERRWTIREIAHKLCVSEQDVALVIKRLAH